MRGDTHAIIGLAVGAALALHADVHEPLQLVGVIGMGVSGALLPDIDHMNSKVSRKLAIVAWPFWA